MVIVRVRYDKQPSDRATSQLLHDPFNINHDSSGVKIELSKNQTLQPSVLLT